MNRSAPAVRAERLVVRRVGGDVWILRLLSPLEGATIPALRDGFSEAIERDAVDVVVDLGAAVTVSTEGAELLAGFAELLRNRRGALWIAAAWRDGAGYTLRPIHEPGAAGLSGVSPALDSALASRVGDGHLSGATCH